MKPLMPVPDVLKPLVRLLEKDEARVLVVVGAGVSIGATGAPHASWLGLLKHGVDHLVTTKVLTPERGKVLDASLDAAFSPFDLQRALQHAELVEQNLTTPHTQAFADWLETAFREFKAKPGNGATIDALRDLQHVGALLLTTNYDSLLSDATGLPPVTWEQHDTFLQVMNRQMSGILHIHGHWERPSSVVLGRSSYNRIAADQDFQDAFKSLWLEWSWVYVGCGDGLDDPNLGRLLEWGKRWRSGAMEDYFLAKTNKAAALAMQPNKPANLVSVGYSDYSNLSDLLRSLTPAARCSPFVPVDEDFAQFQSVDGLFPSRKEYLDGQVPALRADEELGRRLATHGWAFVLDVASVGKTTLALRMATKIEQRDYPVFYLDVSYIDSENGRPEAVTAMQRLMRPNALIILDNVHYQPELARQLWDQWRNHPKDSRLLLVATLTQRAATITPAQDLAFFSQHATNPAIEVRPEPDDLMRILQSIARRIGISSPERLLVPPEHVLHRWHQDFGSALGAFCIAARSRLDEFSRGKWELHPEVAADWVREKWLRALDPDERDNVLCLAVFGAQELELSVPNEALPHPGKTNQMLQLGLVGRAEYGQFAQHRRFSLREPGWGQLILAAQPTPIDIDKILLDTAARDLLMATVLSSRLRRGNRLSLNLLLWARLALTPDIVAKQAIDLPLSYFSNFVLAARIGQQTHLASQCWDALESDPKRLVERAWETQLGHLGSFLDTAKRHGLNVESLWKAIESDPKRLAEQAWETQLGDLGSFLATAKRQGLNVESLWRAIESDPKRLAERAWETPLHFLGSFLDTAKRQGLNVESLWKAIESDPKRLAERAWETQLHFLGSFLDTAKRHRLNVESLWKAIESDPKRLAERAWETPLGDLGSFLDTAKRQGLNVESLWKAIESDPKRLAERAWETQLHFLGSFLDTARRQGVNVESLWKAIESDPKRLAESVWETPLDHVGSFLDTAKRHGLNVESLWKAIESDPKRLAERAWETPLDHVGSFLDTAKRHQRNLDPLVEALQAKPERLSAKAKQTEIAALAGFCHYAPVALIKIALTDFEATHWNAIPFSEPFIGATRVASLCAAAGREDLEQALIRTLLRRANPQDFPPTGMALANVAWLLKHIPSAASALVPVFLDELCTKRWLGWQYSRAGCGPLAAGLYSLALYQPPAVVKRFLNPGLGIRLDREISQFSQVEPEQQGLILQLFGSATLCGWRSRVAWFRDLSLAEFGRLPVDTLPHRPEAVKVEEWQFQLWLGLRALVSTTRKQLLVPPALVEQTLDLWRTNLAESAQCGASVEHQLNLDMVRWLELCSHGNLGLLVPAALPTFY
jgi:tetratricopeptide (TPR) repeat protein